MTDATKSQPTILETIYAQRAKDVEVAKSTAGTAPEDISAFLAMNMAPPQISLVERLKRNPSSMTDKSSISLMAEIKRASPSKGPINMTANPANQALTYALAGASVISVLTEPTWFKGSLLDMRLARQAIDALPDRPAILRKDFILDEYQIAEARLHGADTVLLIVAMLSPERLEILYAYSLSLNMEPLVEVNNAEEMTRALELGAKVIGVNNRNLHDFQVDMGTTSRLVQMVMERDVILCALSGISNPKDVQMYKEQGVRAVLVGEALMRAPDTSAFIRELLQWPELENRKKERPWVFVSGITKLEDAQFLMTKGIDMFGFTFDPTGQTEGSITLETAADISKAIHASRSYIPLEAIEMPLPVPTPWLTTQRQLLKTYGARPLMVGAFRNATLSEIIHAVYAAKLDLVQVDTSVPDGWIRHIPVPVVRTYQVDNTAGIAKAGLHSFALVELSRGDDDEVQQAAAIVEVGETTRFPTPIVLSGGLTTENVNKVIEKVKPWAVEIKFEGSFRKGMQEFVAAVGSA